MIKVELRNSAIYCSSGWLCEDKDDAGRVWHRVGYVKHEGGYVGVHMSDNDERHRQDVSFEAIVNGRQRWRHETRTYSDRVTPTGALRLARAWGRTISRK